MRARQVDPLPLVFLAAHYFGLGVAVRKPDGESGLIGSPGSYGWSGGYNTYFRIDPQEQLIMMLFTQLSFSPTDLELQYGFHNTVMQAIVD
jgi:CubicO group peptidase (beta-lactamase class C family)